MGNMCELNDVVDFGDFFAPTSTDLVDGLLGQYRGMRARIETVAELIEGETAAAISYFLEGNGRSRDGVPVVDALFKLDGAVAALNSAYWAKAMQLTDVLDLMPQARRDAWHASIREHKCPDFDEATVRATLEDLLGQRHTFLAERVDGIFRGLSGEHVTNSPSGFGKRMIVSCVLNDMGYENSSKCGLINDLRCVIGRFMGRDEPGYNASTGLIRSLRGRWGEWVSVDGGALKVRLYRKGTAHIEVHPDVAWRLNSILAHLYPLAIPAQFRQRPARKPKNVPLIQRPLPFSVVDYLATGKQAYRLVKTDDFRNPYRKELVRHAVDFERYDREKAGKHSRAEAESILESLGREVCRGLVSVRLRSVLRVGGGCGIGLRSRSARPPVLPDARRTRGPCRRACGNRSQGPVPGAQRGDRQSGRSHAQDRTVCVEAAQLRCEVLRAKGHEVEQGDFLSFARGGFDRIVMNPPFDQGRWRAHVEHAVRQLAPGGRLVAILPAAARKQEVGPGLRCCWHGPYDNQFPGTSASVVVLVVEAVQS